MNVFICSDMEGITGVVHRDQLTPEGFCQLQGLDGSFDLGFLVGFHSRSGLGGLLQHTLVGTNIRNIRLNGKVVGEIGINAAVMGSFGVPVGLVTGASDLELETIIRNAVLNKRMKHEIGEPGFVHSDKSMSQIGG